MIKQEIVSTLREKEQNVTNWIHDNGALYWEYGPENKWTSGQQIVHLVQSMEPLNKALKYPKFFLKMKFGKANRPSRGYDQIKEKYKTKLKEAGEVLSPFSDKMPNVINADTEKWMASFSSHMQKIEKSCSKWSESDLDKYILPHPLLGMMTVREIIIWTAVHTEHHLESIIKRAEHANIITDK